MKKKLSLVSSFLIVALFLGITLNSCDSEMYEEVNTSVVKEKKNVGDVLVLYPRTDQQQIDDIFENFPHPETEIFIYYCEDKDGNIFYLFGSQNSIDEYLAQNPVDVAYRIIKCRGRGGADALVKAYELNGYMAYAMQGNDGNWYVMTDE